MPVKPTDCGLLAALSLMVRSAVRLPEARGVKVTLRVQLAPVARVEGEIGQLLDWLKSLLLAPVMATPEIVSAAVPVFVRVTDCGALVLPTVWEG